MKTTKFPLRTVMFSALVAVSMILVGLSAGESSQAGMGERTVNVEIRTSSTAQSRTCDTAPGARCREHRHPAYPDLHLRAP